MAKLVFTRSSSIGKKYSESVSLDDYFGATEILDTIEQAFNEKRAFPFYPSHGLIEEIKNRHIGEVPLSFADFQSLQEEESVTSEISSLKDSIFREIASGDAVVLERYRSDIRLSSRLTNAILFLHIAIAEMLADESDAVYAESVMQRRFVVIKEEAGKPTIFHVEDRATVISHVGPGPPWEEIASIYLGLQIFDTLLYEMIRGETRFFEIFKLLLRTEERAIETGYIHTERLSVEEEKKLEELIDRVVQRAGMLEVVTKPVTIRKKLKRFTEAERHALARRLNARLPHDPMGFDYDENLKAVKQLDRLARRYKAAGDRESLREIVKLAVAASGHDIHEVRNRANVILERIFSPREYDAPLATRFIVTPVGKEYTFEFQIPIAGQFQERRPAKELSFFLRIYSSNSKTGLVLEKDIVHTDIPLVFDGESGGYKANFRFRKIGQFDFLVFRKTQKGLKWMLSPELSGRINVIPDVRGEIVLEIFPDIHGYTRLYWWDDREHPGLVYNEHGEVIRLGNFSDITAHLEDMQSRYHITTVYILGAQKRGSNREDWAPGATSPSPFSPMSLVELEPSLGGEDEFVRLVKKAHSLGIKVIIDVIPHLNRKSRELPDEYVVRCYDDRGNLVERAATDGRYGSWNDGKLLNYRRYEVWEWMADSIGRMLERYDIDGIRFDSAHAVPIMMKRNNYPLVGEKNRSDEEMLYGDIVVNDREGDHFITTGYYDSLCRDLVACPFHHFLMSRIEAKLKELKKKFFINISECYWGRERYLARSGIVPYNSALLKICENISRGKSDVREIYHLYDEYFPKVLPEGTELLGILGNHDENRPLLVFGERGLQAASMLISFMSNIILDYEGNAEGEGWKVYLDNVFVNWNQFFYVSNRGINSFYRRLYSFHHDNRGKGYLVWTNNDSVVGAIKFCDEAIWIGAFSFSESTQYASLQFDNPALPIENDIFFRIEDPIFSHITGKYNHITGLELKSSNINVTIPYTDRYKLLKVVEVKEASRYYSNFIHDSFVRLCRIERPEIFNSNFAFREMAKHLDSFEDFSLYIKDHLLPIFSRESSDTLELGLKRMMFHFHRMGIKDGRVILDYLGRLSQSEDERMQLLGRKLVEHNARGPLVFISAESVPFSKSGGLANVVYELPRELVSMGEEVYVITPMYRQGDEKAVMMMQKNTKKYGIRYEGFNVSFRIQDSHYEVGVHSGTVEGIHFILLDHHELFDGLYWGYTGEEKLKRRIGLARASAEVIVAMNLFPLFIFTNDAFAGLFNGIVRSDYNYMWKANFRNTTFFHIIHNGNWQYFDSFERYENGKDLFSLFNLPMERAGDFIDPVHPERINCMATGVRFSDAVITVSPSYAKQIKLASDGLERILKTVIGINNAIGRDFVERIERRFKESGFVENYYERFIQAVETDALLREKVEKRYPELLEGPYRCEKISGKMRRFIVTRMRNKLLLQAERGLKVDPDKVLFTMVHRISEQKGFQLLLEASQGIFQGLRFQGIIGGPVSWGDRRGEELAEGLVQLGNYYRGDASVSIGFQEISVLLLSSDLFLMPSLYEPGGISQLEALACGCLVVARATGGLRDTVKPVRVRGYLVEGNGFLFTDYTPAAFYDAMERAYRFLTSSRENIVYRARINAMHSVYYWDKPARKYLDTIYSMKEIIRV